MNGEPKLELPPDPLPFADKQTAGMAHTCEPWTLNYGGEMGRFWLIRHLADELKALRQQVEDTIAVAVIEEDDAGFISAYHFKTGAIHRLLAKARSKSEALQAARVDPSPLAQSFTASALHKTHSPASALPTVQSPCESNGGNRVVPSGEDSGQSIQEHLQHALSALGTGDCAINTCDGCKSESAIAREEIQAAMEALRAALLEPAQDELVFYRCEACGCLMQTAGQHSVCEAPPACWTRMIGRTALLEPTRDT